ncbi:hypothetical protein TNCV_2615621 [Trichonephila clavipes]|nr:hypothetical protein TNCV_2615621 [Trichonephila clavipes]
MIRIISTVKCYFRLYSPENGEIRNICQLVTCDDHRPYVSHHTPSLPVANMKFFQQDGGSRIESPLFSYHTSTRRQTCSFDFVDFGNKTVKRLEAIEKKSRPGEGGAGPVDQFSLCAPLIITHSVKRQQSVCAIRGDGKREEKESGEREEPGLDGEKGKALPWLERTGRGEKGLVRDWSGKTMNADDVEK